MQDTLEWLFGPALHFRWLSGDGSIEISITRVGVILGILTGVVVLALLRKRVESRQ